MFLKKFEIERLLFEFGLTAGTQLGFKKSGIQHAHSTVNLSLIARVYCPVRCTSVRANDYNVCVWYRLLISGRCVALSLFQIVSIVSTCDMSILTVTYYCLLSSIPITILYWCGCHQAGGPSCLSVTTAKLTEVTVCSNKSNTPIFEAFRRFHVIAVMRIAFKYSPID